MKPVKISLHDATTSNPVMLIDGSPLLYINGNKPDYKSAVDDFMREFGKQCKSSRYIGVIDNGKSFRVKIDSSYKAARPSKETLLEKYPYIYRVKDYLVEKYGFNLINDLEGDDALAIINRRLNEPLTISVLNRDGQWETKERLLYNTVIISIDKDLLQLSGVHLNIKNRTTHIVYNSRACLDYTDGKFYGTSYLLLYAQMMIGDTADNIKGLFRYGAVKSMKVLANTNNVAEAHNAVKEQYVLVYGKEQAEIEFNKTYSLVKMIEKDDSFDTPPIMNLPDIDNEDHEELYQEMLSLSSMLETTSSTFNKNLNTLVSTTNNTSDIPVLAPTISYEDFMYLQTIGVDQKNTSLQDTNQSDYEYES